MQLCRRRAGRALGRLKVSKMEVQAECAWGKQQRRPEVGRGQTPCAQRQGWGHCLWESQGGLGQKNDVTCLTF